MCVCVPVIENELKSFTLYCQTCVLIMRNFQCKQNFVYTMKLMFLLCIKFHIFVFFNIKNNCKWISNLHSNLFDRMKGSTIFENALVFNIFLLVHFNILTDYRLTVNIHLNGYFRLKEKYLFRVN